VKEIYHYVIDHSNYLTWGFQCIWNP